MTASWTCSPSWDDSAWVTASRTPLLDDVLGVVVGHLDQGGAVEQPDQPGQAEERALAGGEAVGVEGGDGVLPDLCEVQICVTHRSHIPFDGLGELPCRRVSSCHGRHPLCLIHIVIHNLWAEMGRGGTLTTACRAASETTENWRAWRKLRADGSACLGGMRRTWVLLEVDRRMPEPAVRATSRRSGWRPRAGLTLRCALAYRGTGLSAAFACP